MIERSQVMVRWLLCQDVVVRVDDSVAVVDVRIALLSHNLI